MPYFSTLFLLKKWGIIVLLLLFLPKKSVFLLNKSEEKGHNCTFIAISSETFSFITYILCIYSIKEYIYYYINCAHTRVRGKDFLIFL